MFQVFRNKSGCCKCLLILFQSCLHNGTIQHCAILSLNHKNNFQPHSEPKATRVAFTIPTKAINKDMNSADRTDEGDTKLNHSSGAECYSITIL